jgi:hypothetical protein
MDTPETFHPGNTATALLSKIGSGCADADFARAVHAAADRAAITKKKAKVILTVEVDPHNEVGALVLTANVEARLPKLPMPSTQFHQGPAGELLDQRDFLMGGGRSEAPAIRPLPAAASSASGRHTVARVAATAPDAAAGKE